MKKKNEYKCVVCGHLLPLNKINRILTPPRERGGSMLVLALLGFAVGVIMSLIVVLCGGQIHVSV